MRARALVVCLLAVASLQTVAWADRPANDEWHSAYDVVSFPFRAEVSLSEATRDFDQFWDCLPEQQWPQSLVEPVYADVWFRVEVPERTRLMAIADVAGGTPVVGVYEPDGIELDRLRCDYDQEPGEPASVGFWVLPGTPALVQVAACINCGYPPEVAFELLEPAEADLAVHSLTVSRPTTSTPLGAQPQPTARDATFMLENRSFEGPAVRGLWRLKACHEHDPGSEYCILIDRGVASLAPGEQLSLAARWDATGSAGDFTICASVTPFDFVENDYENNKVTERTWILVSNVPGESWLNYFGTFWTCHYRSYF